MYYIITKSGVYSVKTYREALVIQSDKGGYIVYGAK